MRQFSIDRLSTELIEKKFHLEEENKIMRKTWRNNVYPFKSSEKIDCQKIKILNE
jgi:hypothetical protein